MPDTKRQRATRRTRRADLPPDRQRLYDRWLAAVHLNGGDGMRAGRELLAAYGAPKSLAEDLIYQQDREVRPRDLRDLADATGVPREWFEVEDWRTLIRAPRAPSREELEDVAREIAGHERALLQERRRRAG